MNKTSSNSYVTAWIFSIISLLTAFYCMYGVTLEAYKNLFVLPFLMAVLIFMFQPTIGRAMHSPALIIVLIIEYLRYTVIPFFMVLNNTYHSTDYLAPSNAACKTAIWLMAYELVIEMLLLCFVSKKLETIRPKAVKKIDVCPASFIGILAVLMILAVYAICILGNYSVRVSVLMFNLAYTDRVFVFGETLLKCASMLLYFALSHSSYQKLKEAPSLKKLLPIFVLTVVWVSVSFGDVRMEYIFKALCAVVLVIKNSSIKSSFAVLCTIVAVASVSVIYMTILDENAFVGVFYFTGTEQDKNEYAHTLQEYFSGPYNVAKSIEVAQGRVISTFSFSEKISLMVRDVFANVFPINTLFDGVITPTLFNNRLYGYAVKKGSQIIPFLGQGYIYFGFLFSFIPMAAVLGVIFLCEYAIKRRGETESITKNLLTYASIYLSMFRMYNVNIVCGFLLNVILLGFLICKVQEFIRLKIVA